MFTTDDVDALNRDFYADSPASYLRQRLMLLVAFADEGSPLDAVFEAGASLGKVTIGMRNSGSSGTEHESSGYAAIESVALAHATSETLLRQLAAHEALPACPWIELSSFLDPGALRRFALDIAESSNENLTSRFRPALRGSHDRGADVSPATWELDGSAIADLARAAADCFLTFIDINNALKHGAAVLHRTPALRMGSPEDSTGVILDLSGPALKHLTRKKVKPGAYEWHEVTRFVDIASLAGQAALCLTQIDAIWSVARARYLNDKSGKLRLLTPESVAEFRTMSTGSGLTGLINVALTRRWSPGRKS